MQRRHRKQRRDSQDKTRASRGRSGAQPSPDPAACSGRLALPHVLRFLPKSGSAHHQPNRRLAQSPLRHAGCRASPRGSSPDIVAICARMKAAPYPAHAD